MSTQLTAENVETIFAACLFKEGEDKEPKVEADGIMAKVAFHPTRLAGHKQQIEEMLKDLPDQFQEKSGGGWSFLNACMDKQGNQWTGLHARMEKLFQLGLAIGKVQCQLPRELWSSLYGGMPYYVVLD